MALHRLKEFYPDYQETLANGQMRSIDSYSVQTQGGDKIGSAKDILVDDSGRFRYLVVDTGPWVLGKSILLPIGLAHFDYENNRIYVDGLSKSQVENLPEYKDSMVVDEHHEEQVRSQYRPLSQHRSSRQFMGQTYAADQPVIPVESMAPVGMRASEMPPVERPVRSVEEMSPIDGEMVPLEGAVLRHQSVPQNVPPVTPPPSTPPVAASVPPTTPVRESVQASRPVEQTAYDRDQALYGYSEEENHGPLRLYEERLIANRSRQKVGEVAVGKRVVTETAQIAEPVERERVVIERHDVTGSSAVPTGNYFQNEEVARLEIYEEQVNVEKQAFVREEVTIRKEVDHETVTSTEQVRREELDVRTEGNPHISQ
ncbi:MAG TPA: DUF2382 domain-containing protein [Trichocoleus sp.]